MATESEIDSLVWYAVYGSSLLKDRFKCYLEGKRFPGAPKARVPARYSGDTSIKGDIPYQLGFKLYFAGESQQWGGGGVAFVGTERVKPPTTLGRAYLLTLQQFRHVVTEENGGRIAVQISKDDLFKNSPTKIANRGWYNILLGCEVQARLPVVTITGSLGHATSRNPPSEHYLSSIRSGLRETYPGMTPRAIDEYVVRAIRSPVSGISSDLSAAKS